MRRTVLATLSALVLIGCGERTEEPSDTQQQVAQLDAAALQQLKEEYPRLGEEPLPEPEPAGDAEPGGAGGSLETSTGDATYYANQFEGRRTASGIPFRQNQYVAAHRGYPFGTILRVTNMRNDRAVNVRVVDRGPYGSSAKQKRTIIDLSRRAAAELDYVGAGRAPVRVEVLEWGSGING